jgi:hypothetical protein
VFHFCLVLFLALITGVIASRERLPPAVETVRVAEADSSGGDSFDDPAGDPLQMSADQPAMPLTSELPPAEAITEVAAVDAPDVLSPTADAQTNVREQVATARSAAAAARSAAAKQLNENLGGSPKSGGGSGAGSGRAGRAARWVMQFNTSNPGEYLSQLGGLGAEIAFPQRGDSYLYFSNLGGSPTSSTRNLSQEKRIYWMDQDPRSYNSVAAQLGIASPPMMIAFLPLALEDKLLKLEKAYKGVQDEDQIQQTIFECVRRGGGYDVLVVDQTLRGN